jgi:deoxyribonuclease V
VISHPWSRDEGEARALQNQLAGLVITEDRLPPRIETVVGVDVAYQDDGTRAFAAAVVVEVVCGAVRQIVSAETAIHFPYVPGLLSFRELPALAAALDKLSVRPDLMICDGQGIAHPRRFGLACHIGVAYDLPVIGCAKTRLTGEAGVVGLSRGSSSHLVSGEEVVGAVLRTQDGIKPVYVSPGHRISTDTACRWTLALCSRYRLPDPIRIADQTVSRMKREAGGGA